MRPEPSHRIDRRAISLWTIHALIQLGFFACALSATYLTIYVSANLPLWTTAAVAGPFLIYSALSVLLFPRVRWSVWRYELDEHELDLQHGLLVVRRTLIPPRTRTARRHGAGTSRQALSTVGGDGVDGREHTRDPCLAG